MRFPPVSRVLSAGFGASGGSGEGVAARAPVLPPALVGSADVAGGLFETLGRAQVGRLALTIPADRAEAAVAVLTGAGVTAEVRA